MPENTAGIKRGSWKNFLKRLEESAIFVYSILIV